MTEEVRWVDPEMADPDMQDRRVSELQAVSDAYHGDPGVRARIDSDAATALSEMGVTLAEGVEVRVALDTEDTVHIVLPQDPNERLADDELGPVSGGSSAGSASTGSSAGTMSSFLGTVSSASSAGSVGSASSAS